MPSHPDGRPMTNVEMLDFLNASHDAKRERIARDGCCGDEHGPMSDGICWGIGPCPRWQANQEAYGFVTRMLDFLNGISQQTFADEYAARLIDDNP